MDVKEDNVDGTQASGSASANIASSVSSGKESSDLARVTSGLSVLHVSLSMNVVII